MENLQAEHSKDQRTAIALQSDEGFKEAIKIAEDILKQTEAQALDCDDAAETIRLHAECRGAGKVFSAPSMEELTDQLAAASEEALQFAAKPVPVKELTAQELADREFVRGQSLATNPTQTLRSMLAEELGVQSIDDVKSRMAKLAEFEANESAQQYVDSHQDTFFPCEKNGKLIQNAMKAANVPCTVANISAIVDSLEKQGLLTHRPIPVDPWSLSLEELKAMANDAPIVESDTGLDF